MNHEQQLSEILARHGPALRRLARVHAGSTDEQDDLLQEMLLQIWRGLPSFRGDSSIGTWVYRIGLNAAITFRRKMSRRPPMESADAAAEVPSRPDHLVEQAGVLHEFLATLGPVDRSVMLLRLEGLSNDEIGAVVGTTAGAVSVRLHRLKQRFEERYVER